LETKRKMTPERYQQIGKLYHSALEITPDECPTFLAQACDGDEELLREVPIAKWLHGNLSLKSRCGLSIFLSYQGDYAITKVDFISMVLYGFQVDITQ
jgi:hypothetical protein